ncbi:(deoxy)nucleoside triphosphate pyrophosphohydrolase [Aquipuribacter nitratireducens]|uniref:8-oxo-dGTP diphosphatase n=1 Tax=Aquipuribacter nitratireducens TaxID=650104 RepID=A0ABW0GLF3_9MICO
MPHVPPTRTRLVVGAAVVDDLDRPTRLLAARRNAPAALAGFWEFPGGKVDPGETAEEALHRELDEELGVRVRTGEEVLGAGCVDDPDHGRVWPLTGELVLRLWLAEAVDGTSARPLADHDELRWLTAHDLWTVPWLPADALALRRIEQLLT